MEQESIYVGIDIAKAQVDVAIRPTDDRWVVPHDETGVRQLVSRLKTLEPVMVLLEASGGFSASGGCLGSRGVPWSSSTPARCGTSPGPPGSWPRPSLDRRFWLTSPKQSVHPCALCETSRLRLSTPWLPVGTR